MKEPDSLADDAVRVTLDTAGASCIEGADWQLRACATEPSPDSPTLLAAALGACAAQVCAPILARAGFDSGALRLQITRRSNITEGLELGVTLELEGADALLLRKLVRAIERCPVSRHLHPALTLKIRTPGIRV